MFDLRHLRTHAQRLRILVLHGLAVSSLVGLGLGAAVGHAFAAPDLDPSATYTYDPMQDQTVITSPHYAIGPWQTVRQSYNCAGNLVQLTPLHYAFDNYSDPNVIPSLAAEGADGTWFAVFFTNWNVTQAQYLIRYTCKGNVQPPAAAQPPLVIPTPGMRVHAPGDPAIYLIDDNGQKLHIADPRTYNALFRDWNGVQLADVSTIPSGPDLNGAYLAMAPGNPAIYLITSQGKRWITSPDAMNRFYFAPQQIKYLPLGLLESIPSGPNLS